MEWAAPLQWAAHATGLLPPLPPLALPTESQHGVLCERLWQEDGAARCDARKGRGRLWEEEVGEGARVEGASCSMELQSWGIEFLRVSRMAGMVRDRLRPTATWSMEPVQAPAVMD